MSKSFTGNFFEDFRIGLVLRHATPRTLTGGDVALYNAVFGGRFALASSDAFARSLALKESPVDELLAFHMVFGKTVADISLNAVANLGYAECRFLKPVHRHETLSAVSEVIGLKENSNRQTGIVYVRTTGLNQDGDTVLSYVRWVMVRKRDPEAEVKDQSAPKLAAVVSPADLILTPGIDYSGYDAELAGSPHLWDDYAAGEKIDHVDGMTVEESDHMLATRLFQNTAKVHFNQHVEGQGRFGRRLIYGGHVISLARALSFNGLANAQQVVAINAGRHVNPLFAGNTVYCWSEVLEKAELPGRRDCGALRLRLVATKDRACADFPDKDATGAYPADVILDLDYWAVMPRRA
ncbi:MAG: MaoC family dehydratase [Micropepsaceae bacterium]